MTKHGYCTRTYTHPLYDAWRNIKRRCYGNYINSKYYKNYGGRGIKMCQEWLDDFNTFLVWALNNGWQEGLTIDRIDNNGNYCPENCRWITQQEQLLNRRNTHYLTYNNITKSASEWAKDLGINYNTFVKRIAKWGIDKAFTEPLHKENARIRKAV